MCTLERPLPRERTPRHAPRSAPPSRSPGDPGREHVHRSNKALSAVPRATGTCCRTSDARVPASGLPTCSRGQRANRKTGVLGPPPGTTTNLVSERRWPAKGRLPDRTSQRPARRASCVWAQHGHRWELCCVVGGADRPGGRPQVEPERVEGWKECRCRKEQERAARLRPQE